MLLITPQHATNWRIESSGGVKSEYIKSILNQTTISKPKNVVPPSHTNSVSPLPWATLALSLLYKCADVSTFSTVHPPVWWNRGPSRSRPKILADKFSKFYTPAYISLPERYLAYKYSINSISIIRYRGPLSILGSVSWAWRRIQPKIKSCLGVYKTWSWRTSLADRNHGPQQQE